MNLPPSFKAAGFGKVPPRRKVRLPNGKLLHPLMIGTQGTPNSGKSEFINSCPGPGIALAIDPNYDSMLENPNHPPRNNIIWHRIVVPLNTGSASKTDRYTGAYVEVRDTLYKSLEIPDCLTVAIDCDSDFWELHRLAQFGKLTGIYPATKYSPAYAEKRLINSKLFESGRIIVGTNKVKDEYETVYKADGTPELDNAGEEKRKKTGRKERQGFPDYGYLWEVQLEHLLKPTVGKTPMQWGIRLLECKPNPQLIGEELWGDNCNFSTLVQVIYPDVELSEWGL
jgi:hypothetical protein